MTYEEAYNKFCKGIEMNKLLISNEKSAITGHWINKGMDKYELSYGGYAYMPKCECSVCGHIQETYVRGDKPNEDELDYPLFCEMCGSKNAERRNLYEWEISF